MLKIFFEKMLQKNLTFSSGPKSCWKERFLQYRKLQLRRGILTQHILQRCLRNIQMELRRENIERD